MKRLKPVLMLALLLAGAGATPNVSHAQSSSPPADVAPLQLSLMDCIREAFKNNKEIRIDSYRPALTENDILFAKAQFDASLTASAFYQDQESPVLTGPTTARGVPSNFKQGDVLYSDPLLSTGGRWQADLRLSKSEASFFPFGPTSPNVATSTTDRTTLTLGFSQPLLRNFGRKVSETTIVLSSINRDLDEETFRQRVQLTLLGVQDAYWTLVYTHQNLDVQQEALRLAQALLKLNQIKVQVGTLPPIDITQAEAGVASKEEAVITAQAAIENAQDVLRRVIGLDPTSPSWKSPIAPTEDLASSPREVDLDKSLATAIQNRPDLAAGRLRIRSADTTLAFDKNQLKYSLQFDGSYALVGLAAPPGGFGDTTKFITGTDFPTYTAQLTLGIPIGNRGAEATYSKQRLLREQEGVSYQSLEQLAIVEVGLAVRRVQTDLKRIDAAGKNRILQEKKVEAEQKKFENGMSTSFQVLTFQNDLADARSREIQAKTSYRISVANLDNVTGVIDKVLNVSVKDYTRN